MTVTAKWVIGACLLTLAGCSGSAASGTSPPPEPAKAPATGATAAPAAPASGIVGVLERALATVQLEPAQKTEVDQMIKAADARHADVKKGMVALKTAIADQLDAGSYDRAKLDKEVSALESTLEKTRTADIAALERLHTLLDESQRNQLVDAVHAELADHGRDGHGPGRFGGFFKARQWAVDLELTDEQRDQMKTAFKEKFRAAKDGARKDGDRAHGKHVRPKRGGMRKQLEAFRGAEFDLDQDALPSHRSSRMTRRMVDALDVVIPILTAEQRKRAAAKIRSTEL